MGYGIDGDNEDNDAHNGADADANAEAGADDGDDDEPDDEGFHELRAGEHLVRLVYAMSPTADGLKASSAPMQGLRTW